MPKLSIPTLIDHASKCYEQLAPHSPHQVLTGSKSHGGGANICSCVTYLHNSIRALSGDL